MLEILYAAKTTTWLENVRVDFGKGRMSYLELILKGEKRTMHTFKT